MLVSWPFALKDMESAGGEGSSDWSSDSGSPLMVWEWRLSLPSSWDWSWYLSEAAVLSLGNHKVASGLDGVQILKQETAKGEPTGTPQEGRAVVPRGSLPDHEGLQV